MSDVFRFGVNLSEFTRGVLENAGRGGRPRPAPDEKPDEFPAAGVDLVHHALRVRLDVGETGTGDEVVTMFGKMIIHRSEPYTNKEGRRQIDFHVRSWEASGWSWTLKQGVTYVLSENVEQPVSTITAQQEDADFPAAFNFNVIFDVRVDNMTVFSRFHGRPEGENFLVVPPNGDRKLSPRMTRFEDTRVRVAHPILGSIQAVPLDCNDLGSLTLAEF